MGADGAILEVGEFVTHHITQLLILQWMKSTGNYFVNYASSHRQQGHNHLWDLLMNFPRF